MWVTKSYYDKDYRHVRCVTICVANYGEMNAQLEVEGFTKEPGSRIMWSKPNGEFVFAF